jgi:hypothetical protein
VGGWSKGDQVFNNQLQDLIKKLNEAIVL